MSLSRCALAVSLIYGIIAVQAGDDIHPGHFDRDTCRAAIVTLQQQDNFTKNTDQFFTKAADGSLNNGFDNMTLTYAGCNEFCGGWTFYWDIGPRLTTWIIPVVLLLSNIELSPIDKKRFMTIIHAVGDPIDSFWSILHKIYIWHRLYAIGVSKSGQLGMVPMARAHYEERARVIGTVLSGFEEITGGKVESEMYYHMVLRKLGGIGDDNEDADVFEQWRWAARVLADARTNEFWRTWFAMFVYIFGVVTALVPEVGGGSTSPPGGRIASAVFLSWLVTLAVMTNTIGTFTSRRTCLTIMRSFVSRVRQIQRQKAAAEEADMQIIEGQDNGHARETNPPAPNGAHQDDTTNAVGQDTRDVKDSDAIKTALTSEVDADIEWVGAFAPRTATDTDDKVALINATSWDHYFNSLQWLGAIYTYRPWKVLYLDVHHRTHAHRSNVLMALGGLFPVTASMIGGFIIMWYAVPPGFSCRHWWIVGVYVVWILSAIFTSALYLRYKDRMTRHMLWKLVLIKDFFVFWSCLGIVFLSTGGLFNNCWCWTAYMFRGNDAYLPLNTDGVYDDDARNIYSFVIFAAVGAQLIFYIAIMLLWRGAFKLVRWSEKLRRTEWSHEMKDSMECKDDTFLLFWYHKRDLEAEEYGRQQRRATFMSTNTRKRSVP
jgi:hypothetical protein